MAWQTTVASGQFVGSAQGAGIVRDASGAGYLSGWSTLAPAGTALLLQKYSADGALLWTRQHPAPQGDFLPRGLGLNSNQQPILCGYSTVPKPMLVVFWYDEAGTLLHEARYESPNGHEIYNAVMAVAPSDQVYLAALTSVGSAIIQFSPTGEQLWLRTEEDLNPASGFLNVAAVDAEDCLLLAGSWFAEQHKLFLWKFAAEGAAIWRREYSEPGWHHPVELKIDRWGHSHILAMSRQPEADTYDILLLSFSPDGDLSWSEYYETGIDGKAGTGQLAIDDSAHLYIAGIRAKSEGHTETFMASYDHQGKSRWHTIYDDAEGYELDQVRDIAVTGSGIMSLTAVSNYYQGKKIAITLRLSASGQLQWSSQYPVGDSVAEAIPEAIAVGEDGRCMIAGQHRDLRTNQEQLLLMGLDDRGRLAWQQLTPGERTSKDLFIDLKVDVSGRIHGLGTGAGMELPFLALWDSDGVLLWHIDFDANQVFDFQPKLLSVDRGGNSYLTGIGQDKDGLDMIVVVRVNSMGQLLWVVPVQNPDRLALMLAEQTLDQQGDLIVTGAIYNSMMHAKVLTFKMNAQGSRLWQTQYGGSEPSDNHPRALTVDAAGNAYVAAVAFEQGRVILKYDDSGRLLWQADYRYNATSSDEPGCLEVDDQENVYLFGYSEDLAGGIRRIGVLSKFDRHGRRLWQQTIGAAGAYVQPHFMAIAANDEIICAGWQWDGVSSTSNFVCRFRPNGQRIWQTATPSGTSYDYCMSRHGDIFILKDSQSGERMVLGIDAAGAVLGEWHLADLKPTWMRVDWNDHFYFAGNRIGYDWSVFDLAKYARPDPIALPSQMILEQNYPNPFNWTTTIRYALPVASQVRIGIYDRLGRQVEELIDAPHLAGWHEVSWSAGRQASGIYFVRLSAENSVAVKKLVLIK